MMKKKCTFLNIALWMAMAAFAQAPELVADLNPGTLSGFDNFRTGFAALNDDRAVVIADDGSTGWEVYLLQGKTLTLLKDIRPGLTSSEPANLTVVGDRVYFSANGPEGNEIWVTDGTAAGTRLAADLVSGSGGINPLALHAGPSNQLWFQTPGRLYVWHEGAAEPTLLQLSSRGEIRPDQTSLGKRIVNLPDNRVAFMGLDGNDSLQVWISDGTSAGTRRIGSFQGSFFGKLYGLMSVKNKVLCAVNNGTSSSSSSINGLYAVSTEPGYNAPVRLTSKVPDEFYPFNNDLAYFYMGGMRATDGTPEGTVDISGPLASFLVQGANLPFARLGNKAAFISLQSSLPALMTASGTAASLQTLVSDIEAYPGPIHRRYGRVFFASGTQNGFKAEIWSSDLTPSGTKKIFANAVGAANGPTFIIQGFLGEYLYFLNNTDATKGRELYRIKIDAGTAAQPAPAPERLLVSPSPAQDRLLLTAADWASASATEESVIITATDIAGKVSPLTAQSVGFGQWQADISALRPGVYAIRMQIGGRSAVGRVVKL